MRAFCASDGHEFDAESRAHALRPLLADDEVGQLWVLDQASSLTGYVVVTWGYSLESGGRDVVLDEIYVAEQGRGLGGTLLEHAVHEAETAAARVVFLETEVDNERARSFYRRHGFAAEASVWMRRALAD